MMDAEDEWELIEETLTGFVPPHFWTLIYCDAKHFQWLVENKLRDFTARITKIAKNVRFGQLAKAEDPALMLKLLEAYPAGIGLEIGEKYMLFADKQQEEANARLEESNRILENPNAIAYMEQLQILVNKEKLRIDAIEPEGKKDLFLDDDEQN
jgi:hypothetical protein